MKHSAGQEGLTVAGQTEHNQGEQKLHRAQDEQDEFNHGERIGVRRRGVSRGTFASRFIAFSNAGRTADTQEC